MVSFLLGSRGNFRPAFCSRHLATGLLTRSCAELFGWASFCGLAIRSGAIKNLALNALVRGAIRDWVVFRVGTFISSMEPINMGYLGERKVNEDINFGNLFLFLSQVYLFVKMFALV